MSWVRILLCLMWMCTFRTFLNPVSWRSQDEPFGTEPGIAHVNEAHRGNPGR